MTKICCKVTAISETVKFPLMGILVRMFHQILRLVAHSQNISRAKIPPVDDCTYSLRFTL